MGKCIIGKEQADAIFREGVRSVILEKRSGAVGDFLNGAADVAKGSAGLIRDLGIYGTITGALGGVGYNIVKDRLTESSPKDEFNRKVQAIIANKKRELEDANWMTRVRGMRDELVRNGKKMDPEEYKKKYDALLEALDERRA